MLDVDQFNAAWKSSQISCDCGRMNQLSQHAMTTNHSPVLKTGAIVTDYGY